MDGGDLANGHATDPAVTGDANGAAESKVDMERMEINYSDDGDQVQKLEKDPRRIARKYQLELCQKAVEENVVVYLGTGYGKTHIAALLIYEMGHLIRKPQKNICIFLAPTVALAQQQAKVIEDSVDFKVGTYFGSSKRLKHHEDWEKEMEAYEVFVMTPQILLHNLSHCFIKVELIALLIFDECHYAQLGSNHPYAEIMKVFYKSDAVKLPRIFGMTASPKLGKGGSIDGLETLLRAKVYSIEDKDELEKFAASPKVTVYNYTQLINGSIGNYTVYRRQLEEMKHQCMLTLPTKSLDHDTLRITKKMLQKLHGNIVFCLENLGLWGALQASYILLKGDHYECIGLSELEEDCADKSLCEKYLTQAALNLASACTKDGCESDLSQIDVLKEPFFSRKILCLIGILRNFRLQPNMKCIIFVNRIVTARSLSHVLRNLKFLSSWKCDFLVGVHAGLKNMSRKATNNILEKFRSGELNLLVATKVGEEGLDIQTCCLVIRFDLPETVASFIQSRGRARMPQSEYAFLVNSDNQKELSLIKHFMKDEAQMDEEILTRNSQVKFIDFEEKVYKVDSTGASISANSSVSLLHRYCSKLPHDEYFNPKPQFYYFDDADGMVCHVILPPNAPVRQIISAPQDSTEACKKDACLKACKVLHEVGALTDYLLPEEDVVNNPLTDDSDSEESGDEDLRRELHEMLIPVALKLPWTKSDRHVSLNCYFFNFCATPADRLYRQFGLYVKAALPEEAERLKLDLHLARGRRVLTELVPSGVSVFGQDELVQAEKFQRMCLKAIIDRSELIPEFVSLENFGSESRLNYFLLPVLLNEQKDISVDWNLVQRCLSSPIFGAPEASADHESIEIRQQLHLDNGVKSIEDVINSLVYVPCKDTFFFISDIFEEKNAYSSFNDSKNHKEHYFERFSIQLLHPDQPLLKAKQVFLLENLLRKKGHSESREKEEHFIELPPEVCQLKIIGFSKDIGSSLSLLPSIMHRLESLLVAIELKEKLSASFPEGLKLSVDRVLEALTTEKCNEKFSLERLEVLGDAFLKYAVGRHLFLLHSALDEGQLTRKRSNIVNNSNLIHLATLKNLQVYIRDQSFEPSQFFTLGRECPVICNMETRGSIHSSHCNSSNDVTAEVRCSKNHCWLHKKTIADVVEALVGAFLVDTGFKGATAFLKWIGIDIDFKESQLIAVYGESTSFLPLAGQIDINALENQLGYKFIHKGLLIQAFVHPSYSNHLGGCYQRLEFLGDAVLDYLITSYLYTVYPKLKPGQLTDLRSASVNNTSFANIAVNCSFQKFILCDSGGLTKSMDNYVGFVEASASGKRCTEEPTCPKALGDLIESCMGAILLDTGFDLKCVWQLMLNLLKPAMSFSKLRSNPLRDLQELCQSNHLPLHFSASKKDGMFSVVASVGLDDALSEGFASNISKRVAKKVASEKMFAYLKSHGYRSKSKSLEEVLKDSVEMEAILIGYDETPCSPTTTVCDLPEASKRNFSLKVHPTSEEVEEDCNITYKRLRPSTSSSARASGWQPTGTYKNTVRNSTYTGGLHSASAKSLLYETCGANYWKPPIFECCKETGPGHLKQFTFKAVVEVSEALPKMLESYGKPLSRKKDAAESAAEGVLFYLKEAGYLGDKSIDHLNLSQTK